VAISLLVQWSLWQRDRRVAALLAMTNWVRVSAGTIQTPVYELIIPIAATRDRSAVRRVSGLAHPSQL